VGVDEEFAAFARRSYLPLVRRAFLLTGDRGEAEDLAQDALAALLVAWRRGALLDPERYVARTLTNRAVSRWRRRSSKDLITDIIPDREDTSRAGTGDDRDLLRRSLLQLPPRQRAVLVLRYFEDLPDAEIADQMGISTATVRSQAARAMDSLRQDGALRGGMEGVR
jgi:RNA polymerase sigma-70 factor (sigma-E family)